MIKNLTLNAITWQFVLYIKHFGGNKYWGTSHTGMLSNPGYFQIGEQIKGGRFLAKLSAGNHRSANKSSSADSSAEKSVVKGRVWDENGASNTSTYKSI